jgi:hypothetical protein
MKVIQRFAARAGTTLVASVFALCAYAAPEAQVAKPALQNPSASSESSTSALKFVADKDKKQTCNKDGTSVAAGTKWCRSGEQHECNGKDGQWVNLRTKCKS